MWPCLSCMDVCHAWKMLPEVRNVVCKEKRALCIYHGSPRTGGGRVPPGTHSECRTGATRSPSESRPRADPGPAGGLVSPDPGLSTPGTSAPGTS